MLYYLFFLSCLFVLKKYGELPHRLLTNGKICRNTDGSSCCIVKTAQGDFFDIRRKMQAFSDRLVPRPTTASFRVGKPRRFCKKNTVNFEKSVNSIDKQGKTGYYILAY